MIRSRVLIVTTLVLLIFGWTACVQAREPDTGSPEVLVKLEQGQPRVLKIGPRGVGLCPGKKGCGNVVTFMWIGKKKDSEEIKIAFDKPDDAKSCFEHTSVILKGIGGTFKKSLTVKDTCTGKQAFFYTATCQGGAGGNCGGVIPVDPGMIIDGGK